jgi:formyl-CoA transferase
MLNGNKETITLNLKSDRGRGLLKELVTHADVLIENFAPGTMERNQVGSETLTALNPRLIYAAATGYGQGGPHRDYLAMDVTVQAMTGVVAITGNEGEPPLKSGPALCDILGGVHLYGAITTALFRRERTGHGAVLDVAMQDAVFPTLCSALGAYYIAGGNPPRTGNHHQALSVAPYNVYATNDGHVAIICIRENHWQRLLDAMGRKDLEDDPRFIDMAARSANMEATDAVVEEWTQKRPKEDVFRICQTHDVICAPVQSLDDVVNDPHLLERRALSKVPHPKYGNVTLPTTALRFSDVEPPEVKLPRGVGADNDTVYSDLLNLGSEEIEELRKTEAI